MQDTLFTFECRDRKSGLMKAWGIFEDACPMVKQPSNSPHRTRSCWKAAALLFVLACLIVDLLPHHGAPDFRYTGSDPESAVWDLGWPFTLFIYDPRNGLHVGPFAYVMLSFQLFLVAVILLVRRRIINTPNLST